ncbi:MAG: DUF4965 domain-containing protein [Planctomycetota bacterium]
MAVSCRKWSISSVQGAEESGSGIWEPGQGPPAAPLVACDPYFSIWSSGRNLGDVDTTHWTGHRHRLTSLVRIDGKAFRVMGAEPAKVPALKQKSLAVLPTRTIYTFEDAGVALTLTFMTAALPEDMDLLSRPVTYLTYEFRAVDGGCHAVEVYFDAAGEIAVNDGKQVVTHAAEKAGDLAVLKIGSREQPVLEKAGDDLRIDWGYFYVAVPASMNAVSRIVSRDASGREEFLQCGASGGDIAAPPAEAAGESLLASVVFSAGEVPAQPVSRRFLLAYDDLYSIRYMQKNLRPYWRRNGWEAADLLKAAAADYEPLVKRCAAFDRELMADLSLAGGEKYARICALAYRQCFAAGKFAADAAGRPMQFCKENHSNGCVGTSDVFYPMAPQFLFFSPSLVKSFLVPFMNYAAGKNWKRPFAPHDLGTYPHANGQTYNGDMPVEESGNLLILFGALAKMEGNADFAGFYWPQLETWAGYLKEKGFDPENQLCTDDFAGHLAHNVNLSVKAICGLGAFGKLCALRSDKVKSDEYLKLAREFAGRWVKEADDGDHFRLTFDKSGTWSQKYNLIWDRILDLNLFPPEVACKEMAYYRKIQGKYGLPLDNRQSYTKLDWILWTATLTQDRADFDALVSPVFLFLNETRDRSPMTDWYDTVNGRKTGFTARPVVGGVFARMLYDKAVWDRYAGRDKTRITDWISMPLPPVVSKVLVPAADSDANITWRYTIQKPGDDWFKPGFDDAAWKQGLSGFGTQGTPGAVVRTGWNTSDIWLRREFILPAGPYSNLCVWWCHDENVEVYINGEPAAKTGGYIGAYEVFEMSAEARRALKPGKNLMAVHCRQTSGGQYVDVGIVEVK